MNQEYDQIELLKRANEAMIRQFREVADAHRTFKRWVVVAFLFVVVLTVSGAVSNQIPKIVQAEQVVLKDKNGTSVAVLDTGPDGGARLTFYFADRSGGVPVAKAAAKLEVSPRGVPSLAFYDRVRRSPFFEVSHNEDGSPFLRLDQGEKGIVRMGFHEEGGPGLGAFDKNMNYIAVLGSLGKDGARGLLIADNNRQERIGLTLNNDGPSGLSLFDSRGTERTALALSADGLPSLGLFNRNGKAGVGLSVNGKGDSELSLYQNSGLPGVGLHAGTGLNSRLEFFDATARPRLSLGGNEGKPEMRLLDGDAKTRIGMTLDDAGRPAFEMMDHDQKIRAGLSILPSGESMLGLSGAKGGIRSTLEVTRDGDPTLRFFNKTEKEVINMTIGNDGVPKLNMLDKDGIPPKKPD